MLLRALFIVYIFGDASLALGNPWCIDHKASSDINQIRCLRSFDACPKSIDVLQATRKGFNEILQRRKACPKCQSSIVNEEKYLSLYHLPFLVIALTSPDRGSVNSFDIHIVFKGGPKQEFEVGMNCSDAGGYEFQSIIDKDPSKKMAKLIKKISQKEYVHYWSNGIQ